MSDVSEWADKIMSFLELNYSNEFELVKVKQLKFIELDFSLLIEFDLELADFVLNEPETAFKCFELAFGDLDNENAINQKTVNLVNVNDINKVNSINEVNEIPVWLGSNKDKALWLSFVVKQVKISDVAKYLKMTLSGASMVFSRPDSNSGLVNGGLVNHDVNQGVVNITPAGITYLNSLYKSWQAQQVKNSNPKKSEITIAFFNLPESSKVPIGALRKEHLHKFLTLSGVVRQKSDVRPQVTSARFECPACGNVISVLQTDTAFKEPSRCSCGRKGRFRMLSKDLVDAQRIVLEDLGLNSEVVEAKRIAVFLTNELCNKKIQLGSRVFVIGVLSEVPVEKRGIKTTSFDIIVNANNVLNCEDKSIIVSKEDEAKIKKFCSDEDCINKLSEKFAPNIKGNCIIKKSLLLQLASKEGDLGSDKRSRIHAHLFGDFGTGKTQLALFSHKIAHKSVMANITTASKVGLTAGVVKDEFLGGWALEAGAVALAGDGLAFLDELDKKPLIEINDLGQPMESGLITVSKANIHQTIPAPARILSCGNTLEFKTSMQGIYTPEILKIEPHVVDRFDLILKSENVSPEDLSLSLYGELVDCKGDVEYLRKHLFVAMNHKLESMVLSNDLRKLFTDFFILARLKCKECDVTLSPRFALSLLRLALASAKIRLASKIELQDAKLAIQLLSRSLQDRGIIIPLEEKLK